MLYKVTGAGVCVCVCGGGVGGVARSGGSSAS